MSETTSPETGLKYGVELVCNAWDYPRSSYYDQLKRQTRGSAKHKRGRRSILSDDTLTEMTEACIRSSPFHGEGHRKIHARLRRWGGIAVSRNRVLRVMREHRLLSPHRSMQGQEKAHDGRIITDHPNRMWATDATKILTLEDGWVWFFGVLEHWNAECMGWHLSKRGTRYTAIEAMTQAIERGFGKTGQGAATGLLLRVDHGSQFTSDGFVNQMRYWGIAISKGFVREPETNGVVERFHRTFKEQVIHGRDYHGIQDLQAAVSEFMNKYNEQWLLEKLGYHSPIEARNLYSVGQNVALKTRSPKTSARQCQEPISTCLAEREGEAGYSVLVTAEGGAEKNFTGSLREEEEAGYSVLVSASVSNESIDVQEVG